MAGEEGREKWGCWVRQNRGVVGIGAEGVGGCMETQGAFGVGAGIGGRRSEPRAGGSCVALGGVDCRHRDRKREIGARGAIGLCRVAEPGGWCDVGCGHH